jgi:dipeptide/tripeptide permease
MLQIGHWVAFGLSCAGLLFLVIHYIVMKTMFQMVANQPGAPTGKGSNPFEELQGMLLIGYGLAAAIFLFGGVCNFLTARAIKQRKNRVLCFITAGYNCLHMPLGTILGVFTFIVLSRSSVRCLFDENA